MVFARIISGIQTVMSAVPGRLGNIVRRRSKSIKGISDLLGTYIRRVPVVGKAFGASAAAAGAAALGLILLFLALWAIPMVM